MDFYIDIVFNQAILRNLIISVREINNDYLNEDIEDVNDSFVLNMQFEDMDGYLYLNVKLNESALSSFEFSSAE